MMYLVANILLFFSFAACLFAFAKGGLAERIGAAVILANLFATMANEALYHNQIISLAIDGLTALVLLVVAVLYASFWLGAVMLLYALQFALQAYYFVLERPRDNLHVVLNNTDWFAISLCLVAGTAMTWMSRERGPVGPTSSPSPTAL
jgi:hypothetical protein